MKNNDQIHLILYFIDGSSENKFLEFEKEVLEYLISNPVPILFIEVIVKMILNLKRKK